MRIKTLSKYIGLCVMYSLDSVTMPKPFTVGGGQFT